MLQKIIVFILSFFAIAAFSQNDKKTIQATRIDNPPKIDGKLDDEVWQNLQHYGDFFMLEPNNTSLLR